MLDHNTFWFSRGTGGVNTVAKIMFLNLGIRVPGIWVFQQFFKQKHRTGKPGKQLLAVLRDLLCGDGTERASALAGFDRNGYGHLIDLLRKLLSLRKLLCRNLLRVCFLEL